MHMMAAITPVQWRMGGFGGEKKETVKKDVDEKRPPSTVILETN